MTAPRGGRLAVAALAAIAGVTVAWWTFALWPVPANGPEWLVRTRAICFGVTPGGLPNAGGWVLLFSQPLSMVVVLVVVWRDSLQDGFATLRSSVAGRASLAAGVVLLIAGAVLAAWRVQTADAERVDPGSAGVVTLMPGAPPPIGLVDQRGDTVVLDRLRGRAVLVAFAYAHCETECPLLVHDLKALRAHAAGNPPVIVIVTLDPWRDTPERLPSIAESWALPADAHVVSGKVAEVLRVLDAWDIPRARDGATGAIAHSGIAFLVAADGRSRHRVESNVFAVEGLLSH